MNYQIVKALCSLLPRTGEVGEEEGQAEVKGGAE